MKLVSVIWAIVRGLLRALAKDYVGQRQKARSGEAKERPWWAEEAAPPKKEAPAQETEQAAPQEPADRASAPIWWGNPAPPSTPPTIKVETDEGTFIAAATFSGEHLMGVRRVERPRQEGESRRRRRSAKPERSPLVHSEVEACSREPEVPVTPAEEAPAATPIARRDEVAPVVVQTAETSSSGVDAQPLESGEQPRVDRATRVRSRLGPTGEPGAPWIATTLATRLALTRATGALAKKGGEG